MEHWNPTVVYQLATERHREDIRRGAAAQQLAETLGARPARARVAAALAALAARLDPGTAHLRRDGAVLAAANQA